MSSRRPLITSNDIAPVRQTVKSAIDSPDGRNAERIADVPLGQRFHRSSGEQFDDAARAAALKPRAFEKRKIEQGAVAAAGPGFCRCIAVIVDPVEIRKRHGKGLPEQPPADVSKYEGANDDEHGGHDPPQNGARDHMREPGAVPGSDGQSCRQDTDQHKIEFAVEDIAKCRGYRDRKLNRLSSIQRR